MASGRPRPSQRRCSLVENPARAAERLTVLPPFGAGGVLVGADDRGVDHLHPLLGRAAPGQGGEHRLEDAEVAPAGEPSPDGVPLPVPLGDRPPARALARPPQDAVEVPPVLAARPAAPRRQQWSDQLPFRVRQITPSRTILPLPQKRENRRARPECPSSTRPSCLAARRPWRARPRASPSGGRTGRTADGSRGWRDPGLASRARGRPPPVSARPTRAGGGRRRPG